MRKSKNKDENQLSLFTPLMGNFVAVKDQIDLMTYPFFSLSKKKRTTPIEYNDGRVQVQVTGHSELGIANIYDADILIYAVSQITEARNRGKDISPRIRMSYFDILDFLGKGKGGEQYGRLKESLKRLQSTSIYTTIRKEDSNRKMDEGMFSWINDWHASNEDGVPKGIEFTVAEWLYKGIIEGKILTLPKKYFRIEGGLNRFLFRLCRKMIGNSNADRQGEIAMKLETVHQRSGSTRRKGEFRKMVEKIVEEQSIPDYWIFLVKKPRTGEYYFYGFSQKDYPTQEEAYKNISFIALSSALDKSKK